MTVTHHSPELVDQTPSRRVKPARPNGRRTRARLLVAAAPAALITAGLFVVMNGLIQVDDVTVEKNEPRPLESVTAQIPDPEKTVKRVKPQQIKSLDLPPPPPRLEIGAKGINLPPIEIAGAAPTLPSATNIINVMTGPVAVTDRTAKPVRPPVLSYPVRMQSRNIEGSCEVFFSVNARGTPYDIRPVCTHSGFESEARRAVSRSEFLPKVLNGQAVELKEVQYPLVWEMEK